MKVGKKIYYDVSNGNVILTTSERQGYVVSTTLEQDIQSYQELSERNPETYDFIELEFGEFAQDFKECDGYRVNPDTKELEFNYPDPNQEQSQGPVYQKPLSKQINDLKLEMARSNTELFETMIMMSGGV